MRWVDAHCHLERSDFADAAPLIEQARASGLVHAVVVGQLQRSGNFGSAIEVAARHHGFLTPTMGIHPHDAAKATEADFAELERICALPELAAIGEAGLDYYYDHSPRDVQRQAFARQCALAKRLGKPLVVHVRDAHADCYDVLKGEGVERGQIHCFTGGPDDARRYLELGFVISISGVVTYKKTNALQEAVKLVPIDRLTVETDTPFLAPVPFRGKKNQPAWVVATGKHVAALKGLPVEEVAEATSQNAARLFGFTLPERAPAS